MDNTHDILLQSKIVTVPNRNLREVKQVSVVDTFNFAPEFKVLKGVTQLDSNGQPIRKDKMINAFIDSGPLTPAIDPYYKFQKEETVEFLKALEHRDTTYILGHSGSGKTAMVHQVAARLNYNVVTINFDGHLSRSDLIGDWRIVGNQQVFRYGLVPLAFTEPGTIVLFDEIDACPPETAFVLQRAISQELRFLMHETNQIFNLHPQNCIVGTANTNGLGDDSSLYVAGTNVQNFSFLNRWKTCIQLDYIKSEDEEEVLKRMFDSTPAVPFIPNVVRVLAAVREAFKSGTMSMPLTTRDGINWLEKIARIPFPMKAARYSFLDKLPVNDATAIAQLIQRHFKLSEKDDRKYLTVKK